MNNKNILVPIDFSANSVHAFNFAVRYSKQNNATLHILHVVDPNFNEETFSSTDDFILGERLRCANEELKKFVYEIPHPLVKITEKIKIGIPYKQILSYSKQNEIDLIIIGSHGWTANNNLFTGSVASKVIELSKIPVICLRTDTSIVKQTKVIFNTTITENWVG